MTGTNSSSDVVIAALRPILEPCAQQLVTLVENTGLQWGKTPRESFWYRSPEWHIFELIAFTCIISAFYVYTRPFWRVATGRTAVGGAAAALSRSGAAQGDASNATRTRSADGEKISNKQASPLEAPSVSAGAVGGPLVAVGAYSKVDRLQCLIYVLMILSQVYIKASRPKPLVQICWLTMPCHFITFGWTYVLAYTGGLLGRRGTNNMDQMPWLRSMATMLVMCLWGPVFAVMFPDWEDHLFWWEGPVFLIHHGLLMLTPIYWAARYRMLSFSKEILLVLVALSCAINFWICTPLAYVSGLNVNYHLHPPTKVAHTVVFRSQWYRFTVVSLLATSATIGWCFSAVVGRLLRMALGLRRGTYPGERDVNAATVHHTLQPELTFAAVDARVGVPVAGATRASVGGRASIVSSAQSKKKAQ